MRKLKTICTSKIKRFLLSQGYFVSNLRKISPLYSLMFECIQKNQCLNVVQIGANDGKSFDPIYDFLTIYHRQINAVLVEPIKEYHAQLSENYAQFPTIKTKRCAIHKSNSSMSIFKVDSDNYPDLPAWTKGIASFNEQHHTLTGIPPEAIVEELVDCITFEKLLNDSNMPSLDLLQIDTEGYDAQIIKEIDFESTKPNIIHFEHGLNENVIDKETLRYVINLLKEQGYEIWWEAHDVTAYQPQIMVDL